MTTLHEAAQQALEFLDAEFGWSPGEAPRIDALRAALAQQDEPVEPVAWMFESERNFNLVGYGGWEKRITERRPNALQSSVRNVTALYTAPPQRPTEPVQEPYTGDVTRIMRDAGMTFHLGLPHKAVVEQMTRVVDLVYAEASIKAAQQFAAAIRARTP